MELGYGELVGKGSIPVLFVMGIVLFVIAPPVGILIVALAVAFLVVKIMEKEHILEGLTG